MLDNEVLNEMMPFMTESYGNAGALYQIGRIAKDRIEIARNQVAALIGAKPEQIIFTSGGTESNNTVFYNLSKILSRDRKSHIIVGATEHDSVLRPAKEVCAKIGCDITFVIPDKNGVTESSSVLNSIQRDTGFVSVMMVNNETGVENPVADIGIICSAKGILFHTDCVQAVGDKVIDVNEIGCDFLSLSSHKIHGPKGVGALYVRDLSTIGPMIRGGQSQEFGMRGGTENVPGIVGFGKACEIASSTINESSQCVSILKQLFYQELLKNLGNNSNILHVNGTSIMHPGKTVNLTIDGVDAQTLVLFLDTMGVCVSAGSACRSHESEPSHVLTAVGISDTSARQSIRVSFSRMNTRDDAMIAAKEIATCSLALREKPIL